MRIDVWADLVCPWCYLGKRRLESALSSFEHADKVDVRWHSYQLDPTVPAGETGETSMGHLAAKLGWPDEQVAQLQQQMKGLAAAEGMEWNHDHTPYLNTSDAHRLLHLAGSIDHALQQKLLEALFSAHFVEEKHIAKPQTLTELALGAGLPADRVAQVLASNEFAEAVAADQRQAGALGANGVPFFVLGEKYGVSGAQPTEVLAQAIEQVWAELSAS